MSRFRLAVIAPVAAQEPAGPVYLERVYSIDVDESLEWARQHADILAMFAAPGVPYTALNVTEAAPDA